MMSTHTEDAVLALKVLVHGFQRKLDETGTINERIALFHELRNAWDQVSEHTKKLTAMRQHMAYEELPSLFDGADVRSITLDGIGRATMSSRVSASIKDEVNALGWLRATGNGGIIKEGVNSSTLAAFARDYMSDTGKDLPEDYFKVTQARYVSLTKG